MSLPANIDAERAVLGAILLDNNCFVEAERLTVAEFSLDSHRRIFKRMSELIDQNRPVDMVTLIDELARHKDLAPIGDVAYISSLIEGVPDRPSIQHYVEIIADRAQQRGLIHLCNAMLARIGEGRDQATPILADFEESLARIAGKPQTGAKPLRDVLRHVLDKMHAERHRESEYIGIPTGVNELDAVLGGIREAELWITGAMPGRGKTSFGIQFAMNAVEQGVPTVDFSLEMKDEQVGRRILAGYSPAEAFGARDAKMLSEQRWKQVIEGAAQLSTLPLFIDETSSLSLRDLRSRVRLYKRKFGIKLAIVDYLRLLVATGRDTRERVTNIAMGLAQLAKDEGIGIVALSQLSRPDDINQVPTMMDLKESGDLEANAHVVLLLYRPINKDTGEFTHQDSIIVGKAREGPTTSIPVVYNESRLIFTERT